ncbi:von Willebrand factor type A domain protein [Caballeronia catudaia]|uniref:von Willebrand factor type A domain protein n=1 Tax=Caballeronia catudaia TaxID=1777136 RepID=A0A157ZKP2_9BURK|nr:VWA domain-containing protein [Caballeronia catudaia]SAK46088.1 von Willebrand factor type A domain protein [Caballeronia catudaia]
MWKFEFPWMFLLLPLPALVWWLAPAYRTTASAVRMPFFREMAEAAGEKPAPGGVRLRSNWLQRLLMPLLWILLLVAAARPVFVEAPVTRDMAARDLLLAIDLSQSMSERDFIDTATNERMDRLSAVKRVVADFIAKRKGDRIGLVVFGDAAYPQAPLTLDHDSVLMLLDAMRIGMAGPRTAIGDALGLAVKLMENTPAQEKVLVLLTDGNDTASAIPPEQAARIAKRHGIVVHTIGIGDPGTQGEDKVDLDALARIAKITGGSAFHALGREQDLAAVYAAIDRLTPEKISHAIYRPRREFYWVPLALAVSILTLYHVLAYLIALLRAPRRAVPMKEAEA